MQRKFRKNDFVIVTSGKNKGKTGQVQNVNTYPNSLYPNEVQLDGFPTDSKLLFSDDELNYNTEKVHPDFEDGDDNRPSGRVVIWSVAIFILIIGFFVYGLIMSLSDEEYEAPVVDKSGLIHRRY